MLRDELGWQMTWRSNETLAASLATLHESSCPYRRLLGVQLELIMEACYQVDLVNSGEMQEGQEIAAIQKALGGELNAEWEVLNLLVAGAKQIRDDLANQLIKVDKLQEGLAP
jgi:L-cysteine desulfidase